LLYPRARGEREPGDRHKYLLLDCNDAGVASRLVWTGTQAAARASPPGTLVHGLRPKANSGAMRQPARVTTPVAASRVQPARASNRHQSAPSSLLAGARHGPTKLSATSRAFVDDTRK